MTQRFQKLGRRGKFQHDNDPQHTAKISQEFLKTTKRKLRGGRRCRLTKIQQKLLGYFKVEQQGEAPPPLTSKHCQRIAITLLHCGQLYSKQLAVQRLEGNLVHQCILILSFAVFTFK